MPYKPINECKDLYDLFEDPSRWTKGAYAKNDRGAAVASHDPTAVCFCLAGGRNRVIPSLDLRFFLPNWAVSSLEFNDDPNTTHADILALCLRVREKQQRRSNGLDTDQAAIPQ